MKDLNEFLSPGLSLRLGERTYQVAPPTKDVGLQLAALVAVGVNKFRGVDSTAEDIAVLDKIDDEQDIAMLSLGLAVYDQMNADQVPGEHIDRAGIYALYYWTLGEAGADSAMRTLYAVAPVEGEAPKASTALSPGRSTASGNPTPTASTPATGSRPPMSDHKPRSRAASRGKTSSTTGR